MTAAEVTVLVQAARCRELAGVPGEVALAYAKVLEAIAYGDGEAGDAAYQLARAALEA